MIKTQIFFRVIPTHYGQDGDYQTHSEPNGTDGEFIRYVRIYAAEGFRFAPPEHSDKWHMVASFQRYTRDGQWFLGNRAWHPKVPSAYTIFRDGVDRFSLSSMLDAFKLAYRLTHEQCQETGEYELYHKTKQRIARHFGEAEAVAA